MGLSILPIAIGMSLAGLVESSLFELLATATLASLAVPIFALAYAVYLENPAAGGLP